MQKQTIRKYQTGFIRRYTALFLMIFLGYLCEACVIPYVNIFGIRPNLLYVIIGIITVAYGKLRAFWAGLIFGILMEIMLPSVPYLNLALYPVTTLFCSFAFADKPLKTLEYERATNKVTREIPAWIRTVLCTALNILIYEVVNVTYVYLYGTPLTFLHFVRAFADILITSLLCLALLFPLRRIILGPKVETLVLKNAPVVFHRS